MRLTPSESDEPLIPHAGPPRSNLEGDSQKQWITSRGSAHTPEEIALLQLVVKTLSRSHSVFVPRPHKISLVVEKANLSREGDAKLRNSQS